MADIDEEAALFHGTTGDSKSNAGTGSSQAGRPPLDPWKKFVLIINLVVALVGLPFAYTVISASSFDLDAREATEFSVQLAGVQFQGLDAAAATLGGGARTVVSSRFTLRVRAENSHTVVKPWCYGGGGAVVSYAGVAFAWGQVPRFCVERRRTPTELTVIAWGRGVGLSEDLRRRLASDWRMGAAQVEVEMKLFYEEKGSSTSEKNNGPVLQSFQLTLRHGEHHD